MRSSLCDLGCVAGCCMLQAATTQMRALQGMLCLCYVSYMCVQLNVIALLRGIEPQMLAIALPWTTNIDRAVLKAGTRQPMTACCMPGC